MANIFNRVQVRVHKKLANSSSSSEIFTEFMLSSSSFNWVQAEFKTQSTFFEIEFRDFCFSSSSSAKYCRPSSASAKRL